MAVSLVLDPGRPPLSPKIQRILLELTEEAAREGASAAFLFGSYARGAAFEESDVDLAFVGADREWICDRRYGLLVSAGWRLPARFLEALDRPDSAPWTVPGLRSASIIWDPHGVAAGIQAAAQRWSWTAIEDKCAAWVPEQVASLAEDAQRAYGHFRRRKQWVAAVLKGVLSSRLAMILAVHLRILYDSENHLWDLVARHLGEPWTGLQSAALCSANEDFRTSFDATMQLYSCAAGKVFGIMNERQRRVVRGACEIIGHPITPDA
jgi:predicted nucleotidyltransferase